MKWGVLDTKDNLWMGDTTGPKLFDDELIARVAAQLVDVRLRQQPGRTRARAYMEPATRMVDEKTPCMTTLEALKAVIRGARI